MDTADDALLPSSSQDSVIDVRTSYDDLRRLNRSEHEKKRYEPHSRTSQLTPGESTTQPLEPRKPRKPQIV